MAKAKLSAGVEFAVILTFLLLPIIGDHGFVM